MIRYPHSKPHLPALATAYVLPPHALSSTTLIEISKKAPEILIALVADVRIAAGVTADVDRVRVTCRQ